MSDTSNYEVCERNGDCQKPAAIYYKVVVWRGQRPCISKIALCEHHAQAVMPLALKNPLRHQVVRIDQMEFPF